jgi:hypothetical protein
MVTGLSSGGFTTALLYSNLFQLSYILALEEENYFLMLKAFTTAAMAFSNFY